MNNSPYISVVEIIDILCDHAYEYGMSFYDYVRYEVLTDKTKYSKDFSLYFNLKLSGFVR